MSDERPNQPMASLVSIDGALLMWCESDDLASAKLFCYGRKRHYRVKGDCKHTDQLLAALRPELREKTTVVGWGGKER